MTTLTLPRVRGAAERAFYTGMALAIFAAVFLGFARSFFLRPWYPEPRGAPETFFYLHGAVFAAWFVLLVVQASLVGVGRTDLHRRLGTAGALLAVAMVVTGTWGALVAARRPGGFVGIDIPPLRFLAIPLFDMALFGLLVGIAVARRRDPQTHKRLMLAASIAIIAAAVARWPFDFMKAGPPAFLGITDLFLVPLVIWDVATRRRLHPATLWAGLALLVSQPLRLWVSGTAAWMAIARWATGFGA
jgi:uncharacterized membrane protein YozB (DUF420 family)